jgi:hypothetical protein
MLGWIREKMLTQESASGGGRFSASNSIVTRNGTLACSDPCIPGEDCLIAAGNGYWDITHTSDLFSKGERPGKEPSVLVQHTHHIGGSSDGQVDHDTTSATGRC